MTLTTIATELGVGKSLRMHLVPLHVYTMRAQVANATRLNATSFGRFYFRPERYKRLGF